MAVEDSAHETKGVTVDLLSAIDLGPEVEGMAGLQLRMRMVTIEPGGVFGPLHDHKGRPGMVYVLQGTITSTRASAWSCRRGHGDSRLASTDRSATVSSL
jgi:quercetin dioxygenase-like cupin family protein